MVISEHARSRLKERCGLPKKAIEKNVALAFEKGLTHSDARGPLKRYFDSLYFYNKAANNIRIYGQFVYIFTNEELVTVFPLPHRYIKQAIKLAKQKEEGGS